MLIGIRKSLLYPFTLNPKEVWENKSMRQSSVQFFVKLHSYEQKQGTLLTYQKRMTIYWLMKNIHFQVTLLLELYSFIYLYLFKPHFDCLTSDTLNSEENTEQSWSTSSLSKGHHSPLHISKDKKSFKNKYF